MRKMIGTIVILLFLYVGFFGCERYHIKPFIAEWLQSDKPEKLGKGIEKVSGKVKEITDTVVEKGGKVKEITDTVVEKGDKVINSSVNE